MSEVLNVTDRTNELDQLFQKIKEGNVILFLGAGASISGDRGFLSKHLISFFEDKKQIDLKVDDIVEFVDVIESSEEYSRSEFDEYVEQCLRSLKPTITHDVISENRWKRIITTNVDNLLERSFEQSLRDNRTLYRIKLIRNQKELVYQTSADEIKLIKLNGCISAKKEYPLVFSTDDFTRVKKYYRTALQEMKNPSDSIIFLAIGYSFSDPFAKYLLQIMEDINYRDKRRLYIVDPTFNVNKSRLLSKSNIGVISSTSDEFFSAYKGWHQTIETSKASRLKLSYSRADNTKIFLPPSLLLRLSDVVIQLNNNYRYHNVNSKDYYSGEEPDFGVILKGYDVVKSNKLRIIKEKILAIAENSSREIIPLIFLTGTFGSGKSSFGYRLLSSILSESKEIIAFEIWDPLKVLSEVKNIVELISKSKSSVVLFYLNNLEMQTYFNRVLEFRNSLSIEQISNVSILLISTIRENTLELELRNKSIKNKFEFNVDERLNRDEIVEFVQKLKDNQLIYYRDAQERNQLVSRIDREYNGDSFVSFLALITKGKHKDDLLDAYEKLSDLGKEAFKYVSILHQHNISMPASILRSLVARDWQEFRDEVINVEGKGILIQDSINSNDTDSDLNFRTKHPLIATTLLNTLVPNLDHRFKLVKRVVNSVHPGGRNCYILIDFLRALRVHSEVSNERVDALFDLAYTHFSDDPNFLLHYSINLQNRGDLKSLERGDKLLQYAESIIPKRNHRITHRRAVITFGMCKLYYLEDRNVSVKSMRLWRDAIELFEIKRLLDPCSSYSYSDFIECLFWHLESVKGNVEEELSLRIQIEELIEASDRVVADQSDRLTKVKDRYYQNFLANDKIKYLSFLDSLYGNQNTRHYSLMLRVNFLQRNEPNDAHVSECFDELENYTSEVEVAKFLFKHYGRSLQHISNRLKLFDLIKRHPTIEDKDSLRYNYYMFVAECYSRNFKHAYDHVRKIRDRFNQLNPEFQLAWKSANEEIDEIFDGVIIEKKGHLKVRIMELGSEFSYRANGKEYSIGKRVLVNLRFYLFGVMASIVKEN